MNAGSARRRILIVEDETIVAMLLEDIIDEIGCAVVGPVGRVAAALELVGREAIDGAILDVNLDGEQSYGIADELAARGLPYIFVTGHGEHGLDPAYRGRPVLQKPFTHDRVQHALAQHVFR